MTKDEINKIANKIEQNMNNPKELEEMLSNLSDNEIIEIFKAKLGIKLLEEIIEEIEDKELKERLKKLPITIRNMNLNRLSVDGGSSDDNSIDDPNFKTNGDPSLPF